MKSNMLIAVLTKDEEANIGRCLSSVVPLGCDVVVVDSGSTDRTVDIAREMGARVEYHEFLSIARQRNWVLSELAKGYDWVLFLDADERLSAALQSEVAELPPPARTGIAGYYLMRHFYFMGRHLRHGGLSGNRVLRLLDPTRSSVVEQTRTLEYAAVKGRVGSLKSPLIHENAKPLSDWIRKHDWYSTREAEDEFAGMGTTGPDVTENKLYSFINARVVRRIPPLARPFLYFVYNYFLRLGFLDGKPGFIYHFMHDLWYPLLTAAKLEELKQRDVRA